MNGMTIARAMVEACRDLDLSFTERLLLYRKLIPTLGQEAPDFFRFPKDTAWALAASRDPHRDGLRDAEEGHPRDRCMRELLKEGHATAILYEKGYASFPQEKLLELTQTHLFKMIYIGNKHDAPYPPLAVALALRGYLDAGGEMSEEIQTWITQKQKLVLEELLQKEASGEIYGFTGS